MAGSLGDLFLTQQIQHGRTALLTAVEQRLAARKAAQEAAPLLMTAEAF